MIIRMNNNYIILFFHVILLILLLQICYCLSKELKRIALKELEGDPYLMTGVKPFVLTGAMDTWKSLEKFQDLNFFIEKYPNTIVDYYPNNLAKPTDKPYLQNMEQVMTKFMIEHQKTEIPFEERYNIHVIFIGE